MNRPAFWSAPCALVSAWLIGVPAAQLAAATDSRMQPEEAGPGPRAGPMSVVIGIDRERHTCLAGGAGPDGFVEAEEIADQLADGDRYTLFDLSGRRDEVLAIGRPRSEGSEGECASLWRQELSLDPRDGGEPAVALRLPDGRSSPLPDMLEVLPEPLAEHQTLVSDFLSKRGIADPRPKITQAIRADLDGDGTPEYLLNAVRVDPEQARAGDHSVLLVVRGEAAQSRTYIIQDEVDLEDSEFSSTLWTNTIIAVVDVDGDGTAEIITEGGFIYGGGWDVIRFDGSGYEYVLFCGCEG